MPEQTTFDWEFLVPRMIHPTKVAIIEMLCWFDQPLSASDMARSFDDERYNLSLVAYHLRELVSVGVLEKTSERQTRGTVQKFYAFTR